MNSDTPTLLHRPLFDALLPGLLVREGGARITNDPSDAGGVKTAVAVQVQAFIAQRQQHSR